MTVTLTLLPEIARLLEEKATRRGTTLEVYLAQLAESDAHTGSTAVATPPDLSPAEFDLLLDELADGPPLPRLPLDFSRADIYADHD